MAYFKHESPQHHIISGREITQAMDDRRSGKIAKGGFDAKDVGDLKRIGIDFGNVNTLVNRLYGMDALQPTITTASIGTPVQLLQEWLPGYVDIMTNALKIDEIIGIKTAGSWADEMVIQGVRELTNKALAYSDTGNVPLASWNVNFVERTVVRFEQGFRVTRLDEERSARMRIDMANSSRESAMKGLNIQRNYVGFFGFNSGENYTYGFLNDPNLLAYQSVQQGASGSTLWSTKTYLEIIADLKQMISQLRNQAGDNIDPFVTPMTLAVATVVRDYLSTVSDFGSTTSVMNWLNTNYPGVRVVSAPELNAADGGANVAYLFADRVQDTSTDGGETFVQVVPMKSKMLGVMQLTKGYEEDYSNATAGTMVKRPFAVYRITGI